jgi:hypothetical protein
MTAITELLRGHPEVALFAALSLGFFVGKRKVGTFSLGTSAGVLPAGVVIGQLRIPIPALLKSVCFALFKVISEDVAALAGRQPTAVRDGIVHYVAGAFMELVSWWLDARTTLAPSDIDKFFHHLTMPALEAIARLTEPVAR